MQASVPKFHISDYQCSSPTVVASLFRYPHSISKSWKPNNISGHSKVNISLEFLDSSLLEYLWLTGEKRYPHLVMQELESRTLVSKFNEYRCQGVNFFRHSF